MLTNLSSGIYAKKGICVLAGNDFNAMRISDALVGMGEATHPEGRPLKIDIHPRAGPGALPAIPALAGIRGAIK